METIDRYRRYLKRRNFSPHTIKNYLHRLSLFATWLTLPVEEATKSEIGRYIDHLLKKRLSAQTITCHLQTIRLFFDYLITEEQMALCNPITKVSIRLPKPLPRHLKDDQVHQFLRSITDARDKAICMLMLRSGLRVEEVAHLTVNAVELGRNRLFVAQGKGGKDRVVYLSKDARSALEAYLAARGSKSRRVFLVQKGPWSGTPLSVRGIQKRIEYYARESKAAKDQQLLIPSLSIAHVINDTAHALVVGRVEPEHAGKNLFRFFEPTEPPETETIAVQTPEERTVVDVPPGKKTLEVFSERELTDAHAHLVVTDGFLRFVIEGNLAEVRMGIETPEISDEEVHERAVCFTVVAGLFQLDRFEYGIRIRVIGVLAGDHLFHLIHRSWTPLDDRFRPRFHRLIRFSPVMFLREPHALLFELKRRETEGGDIEAPRLDFSGEIRMPRVTPLLPRRYGDDLARHHIPGARRPEGNVALSRDTAGDGISLYGQGDQFNIMGEVEIILRCFFWFLFCGNLALRIGIDAEPRTVRSHIAGSHRTSREEKVASGYLILGAVIPPAARGQSPPLILVLEGENGHRLSDHEGFQWQRKFVLKHLPEGPELFVVAAGIHNNFIDQGVKLVAILFAFHGVSLSSTSFLLFINRTGAAPSSRRVPCRRPYTLRSRALLRGSSSSSSACIRCRTTSMAL